MDLNNEIYEIIYKQTLSLLKKWQNKEVTLNEDELSKYIIDKSSNNRKKSSFKI